MKNLPSEQTEEQRIQFWTKMFSPRTKKYLRDTLRRLKAGVSTFETFEENQAKIQAIKNIL